MVSRSDPALLTLVSRAGPAAGLLRGTVIVICRIRSDEKRERENEQSRWLAGVYHEILFQVQIPVIHFLGDRFRF